jgi:hypothetical protein
MSRRNVRPWLRDDIPCQQDDILKIFRDLLAIFKFSNESRDFKIPIIMSKSGKTGKYVLPSKVHYLDYKKHKLIKVT